MTVNTMTHRDFDRGDSGARPASESGPMSVADLGQPAPELLTQMDCGAVLGEQSDIVELLAMPGLEDIVFAPPCGRLPLRAADLSDDEASTSFAGRVHATP